MNFKTAVVVFFSTWALYGIAKLLPEPFSKISIGFCLSLIILISAFVSKKPRKTFGEELAFANKSFLEKDGADRSVFDDPALRARLSQTGFRAFLSTVTLLEISRSDALRLLGNVPEAIYDSYVASEAPILDADTLLLMSHVFGIVASLRSIFADDESGRAWLHSANRDAPFNGLSPLAYMVDESLAHLRNVRSYLFQWEQG